MSDGFVSLIRTGVAIVVGALITWLAARNFEVDATAQEALTYGLTSVVTVVYYGLVRWGESQWPMLGVLQASGRVAAPQPLSRALGLRAGGVSPCPRRVRRRPRHGKGGGSGRRRNTKAPTGVGAAPHPWRTYGTPPHSWRGISGYRNVDHAGVPGSGETTSRRPGRHRAQGRWSRCRVRSRSARPMTG
jgi:hypothetical protein